MLKYKPNFAESVERWRRFWNMEEPLDRVPCSIGLPRPPSKSRLDGSFYGRLDDYLKHVEVGFRLQAEVMDDWLPIVIPQYGHALISGLITGRINVVAETTWSVPVIEDWSQVDSLALDFDNEYGRAFQRDYDRLFDWARGKCGVAHYEVEGISDTMAALRGTERLCMDYYDAPGEVHRFAHRVTDLLIEWGRWNAENVDAKQDLTGGPLGDQGGASGWRMWMPYGSLDLAEDATVLISPDLYREFIQPEERRLTDAFARTLIEVHHEGNRHIAAFGEVPGISVMACDSPLKMAPQDRDAMLRLAGRKAFATGCRMAEAEEVLACLGTRGVHLSLGGIQNARQAREALADMEKWTAKYKGRGAQAVPAQSS